jgi:hypothetical protein
MAQLHPAPSIDGAGFAGKSRPVPVECSGVGEIRTIESLFGALKEFFKRNPGWE